MASRFRILESLTGSSSGPAPAPWRDRALAVATPTTYDVVPAAMETIPSANGTHPLLPFSMESIEPPRPTTGGLILPAPPASAPGSGGAVAPSPAPTGALGSDQTIRHTGYLTGISLSGILQMLHMERNSCLLEVTSAGRLGTLTMVNGELIDAEVGDECGDAVAMRILRWPSPVTSILPSGTFVRHSVNHPLTQLLMDAFRQQDEAIVLPGGLVPDEAAAVAGAPAIPWRWQALPGCLVSLGAAVALLMTASADEPVATAGVSLDQTTATAAVARGVRTWSSLLVDGVDRVHVIAGGRRLVFAALSADLDAFIYLEVAADMPLGAIWQAIAEAS